MQTSTFAHNEWILWNIFLTIVFFYSFICNGQARKNTDSFTGSIARANFQPHLSGKPVRHLEISLIYIYQTIY